MRAKKHEPLGVHSQNVHPPASAYEVKTIPIHEAKTNFSRLVKQAESGKIIFIGAYGKPTVMLTAADQKEMNARLREDAFGGMKEKMELSEGWDAPLSEEIIGSFYNSIGLKDFEKK
jgi:antitoxin (DNA-binding transcriptional repressor) of toxin-antitoxin stability system